MVLQSSHDTTYTKNVNLNESIMLLFFNAPHIQKNKIEMRVLCCYFSNTYD